MRQGDLGHASTGCYFKWCKGCKRFRNLRGFAGKLAASKCDGCRAEVGRATCAGRKAGTTREEAPAPAPSSSRPRGSTRPAPRPAPVTVVVRPDAPAVGVDARTMPPGEYICRRRRRAPVESKVDNSPWTSV